MIIDCISDLHGNYPKLEGGDLLIVAGDLTGNDSVEQMNQFIEWLDCQNYYKKILIGGNHDGLLEKGNYYTNPPKTVYLLDSETEFEDLKIWGSPWTLEFEGMNPHCKAFTCKTEEELEEKLALIPEDLDILVTHGPPKDVLDEIMEEGYHVGSVALENAVKKIRPKLHVFGHIHEGYGQSEHFGVKFVNASHVDENYRPVNKPVRIEL